LNEEEASPEKLEGENNYGDAKQIKIFLFVFFLVGLTRQQEEPHIFLSPALQKTISKRDLL